MTILGMRLFWINTLVNFSAGFSVLAVFLVSIFQDLACTKIQLFEVSLLILIFIVNLYMRFPKRVLDRELIVAYYTLEELSQHLKKAQEKQHKLTGNSIPKFLKTSYFEMVDNAANQRTHTDILKFESVSIIYADVIGFTKLSTVLPTRQLFDKLNTLFSVFDELVEKYSCLRVRILGDAYYAVCGLPVTDRNTGNQVNVNSPRHASNAVLLGIEMVRAMIKFREEHISENKISENFVYGCEKVIIPEINMRVGINSGSVMCGLFGKLKLPGVF